MLTFLSETTRSLRNFKLIEHCQPDSGLIGIGPGHPMAAMGGNVDPVTGLQATGRGFVFKVEFGGASKERHPLILVLIVPEAGRACLPGWRRSARSARCQRRAVGQSVRPALLPYHDRPANCLDPFPFSQNILRLASSPHSSRATSTSTVRVWVPPPMNTPLTGAPSL